MASTNKTDNLNLSQFIDTDKPSWLTDYNNDMDSIDESVRALRAQADATDTAVAALQEGAQALGSDVSAVRAAVDAVEERQDELAGSGIGTYTHSKEDAVHTLTGTGDNIKFVATAGYAAGDTFVVNGAAYEAKTIDGRPLCDEYFVPGATVMCFLGDGILNFALNKVSLPDLRWKEAARYAVTSPLADSYPKFATGLNIGDFNEIFIKIDITIPNKRTQRLTFTTTANDIEALAPGTGTAFSQSAFMIIGWVTTNLYGAYFDVLFTRETNDTVSVSFTNVRSCFESVMGNRPFTAIVYYR